MDRPSITLPDRIFILYRFYSPDNTLLYVGLTRNPANRLSQHAGDKEWWKHVARIEFEHYADLDELKAAERVAIEEEKPTHNIRMNGNSSRRRSDQNDPLTTAETDGLVGLYFHSFKDVGTDSELETLILGRAVVWQGRVLEEIKPDLYRGRDVLLVGRYTDR